MHRLSSTRAALLALCLWGCSDAPGAQGPRNLILISIDTLRADHLGCYGYDRPTTPAIDSLAARGTVFEDASSTSSWTISSHFSILTGLFPRAHGVVGWKTPMPDDIPTLASVLADNGWDTGGFVNVSIMQPERGFGRGFDTYVVEREAAGTTEAAPTTGNVLDRSREWLAERSEAPFFLFMHFYDVHSSYTPRPRFREQFTDDYSGPVDGTTSQLKEHRLGAISGWKEDDVRHLEGLYDGGIGQLDATLGRFLDELEADGRLDDTLVVITSDHGEEFLEHGGVLHGKTLHQEVLHVPLILAGPGVPEGARVPEAVCLVDVVPTVLTLLGVRSPDGLEGVDLTQAFGGGEDWPPPNRLLFAEADKWFAQQEGENKRSIRRGRYKLHVEYPSETRRLYDLELDPREQVDVSTAHPELVEMLWARLESYMEGRREVEESLELSEEDLDTLRALGYL